MPRWYKSQPGQTSHATKKLWTIRVRQAWRRLHDPCWKWIWPKTAQKPWDRKCPEVLQIHTSLCELNFISCLVGTHNSNCYLCLQFGFAEKTGVVLPSLQVYGLAYLFDPFCGCAYRYVPTSLFNMFWNISFIPFSISIKILLKIKLSFIFCVKFNIKLIINHNFSWNPSPPPLFPPLASPGRCHGKPFTLGET